MFKSVRTVGTSFDCPACISALTAVMKDISDSTSVAVAFIETKCLRQDSGELCDGHPAGTRRQLQASSRRQLQYNGPTSFEISIYVDQTSSTYATQTSGVSAWDTQLQQAVLNNAAAAAAQFPSITGGFILNAISPVTGGITTYTTVIPAPSPPPPTPPPPPISPPPSTPPSPPPPPMCSALCASGIGEYLDGAKASMTELCVHTNVGQLNQCRPQYGSECAGGMYQCYNTAGTQSAKGCKDKKGKWRKKKCAKKAAQGKCIKNKVQKKCKLTCDVC